MKVFYPNGIQCPVKRTHYLNKSTNNALVSNQRDQVTGLGSIIWKISFIENRPILGKDDWKVGWHAHSRTHIRTLTHKHWYYPIVIARWTEAILPAFRGEGRAEEQSEGKLETELCSLKFREGQKKRHSLNDSDDSLCSESSGWILVFNREKGYVSFCVERGQKKRTCEPKCLFHVLHENEARKPMFQKSAIVHIF